ncbi:MAG: epoxyqueuosine reductase QueH [Lachnospiraceae bacterium]|nr:epoxyqueuosine reductase QueH [Lachnospiraceae bacterium]
MQSPQNYQIILDKILNKLTEEKVVPTMLLHSCCAPCSSYVLEYLSEYFKITILYYNPNIGPETEYMRRKQEQIDFISRFPAKHSIEFLDCDYEPLEFFEKVKGKEHLGEKSERCYACYELRLEKTAKIATELGVDYFTTTLSISPHKNAFWLNEIGEALSETYGVKYLFSDFKKKGGYYRSTELAKEYGLYRQDYCGCVFSKQEREQFQERKVMEQSKEGSRV